jgi:hypothetical protein
MSAVEKLLDKAKDSCSPPNYSALAARMGVSRQALSRWKNGTEPMPDERIAQAATMAKADSGQWLLTIHAERAEGAAAKGWESLLRRFGAAAAVAVVALMPLGNVQAGSLASLNGSSPYALCEVADTGFARLVRTCRPFPTGPRVLKCSAGLTSPLTATRALRRNSVIFCPVGSPALVVWPLVGDFCRAACAAFPK